MPTPHPASRHSGQGQAPREPAGHLRDGSGISPGSTERATQPSPNPANLRGPHPWPGQRVPTMAGTWPSCCCSGPPNLLVTTEAFWDTCREPARAQRGTQLPCALGSLPGHLAGLGTSQSLEHGACVAAWDPSRNAGGVFSPFLEGLCPKDQEPGPWPRAPGPSPALRGATAGPHPQPRTVGGRAAPRPSPGQ